ncbi:CoA transferase subunit A [Chloroflexota bacterium]
MKNKIYDSPEKAVADIPDGVTMLLGGWGGPGGYPSYLTIALAELGCKNLTVVHNTGGQFSWGELDKRGIEWVDHGILFANKQVKKLVCSFPVIRTAKRIKQPYVDDQWKAKELEIEVHPQGTLAEKIRCGGAGLGGFWNPVGPGTVWETGKEKRVINGREHVMDTPLRGDFALIRAQKADKFGNLVYHGITRTFNAIMATAADVTIVEADEIVELGEIDPQDVITPGVYVDRIVKRPDSHDQYQKYCELIWAKHATK